jgi:hypothetical protein
MTVPVIALNTNPSEYSTLVSLGNRVASSLTGNALFTTPAVSIANLQAAITDVENAIAKWGEVGNRGSHADLVDLTTKSTTLYSLLKAEAAYVEATCIAASPNDINTMASMMVTSGFALKSSRHRQDVLQQVRNLRFKVSGSLNRNQVMIAWSQPLGVTSQNNVKSYYVYRSATTNFADAVHIDTVTKGEFIDTNDTGAVVTWSYFVAAVGAAGEGALSAPITVSLVAS